MIRRLLLVVIVVLATLGATAIALLPPQALPAATGAVPRTVIGYTPGVTSGATATVTTAVDAASAPAAVTAGETSVPVMPVAPDRVSETDPVKCARVSVVAMRATPPLAAASFLFDSGER